jgi:hypothetical protein
MPLCTLTADDLEGYFVSFAKKLFHAPGAPNLGEGRHVEGHSPVAAG